MANFVENEIDTVSRDLRYLISLGKVSQQQTIADIAEKTLELLKSQPQIIRKPVVGYEGIYEVDNFGRVFSVDRVKQVNNNGRIYDKPLTGKRMKQHIHSNGYKVVPLTKDGKTKTCFVHRIVAEAFIDNPNNLPMINHKDEDRTNNEADNLEWCDARYNMMYGNARAKRMKTIKKNHPDWYCADGERKT